MLTIAIIFIVVLFASVVALMMILIEVIERKDKKIKLQIMKYPEVLDKMINSLFLKGVVKEMAEKLNDNKKADAYETLCGVVFLEDYEDVQVKIIVTGEKEDFIVAFDVIEHNTLVARS